MESISLLGLLRGCCKCGDCGQEVHHIICPKRRAERLLTRMNELKGYKDGTLHAVREKITEQPWLSMHPNVEVWTQSVDALSELVDKLNLQGDLPFWRRLCCCYTTYALGDKIEQYVEDIKRLEERRDAIKDDLVIDEFTIDYLKEKLKDDMDDLRATKRDLERKVSGLETATAFPPRVRSERVKLLILKFDSLEAEVSKILGSIGSSAAAASTSAANPNEITAAAYPNEGTTAPTPNESAVAASTSAIDSNEVAAVTTSNEAAAVTASNEPAATTITPSEAARKTLEIESKLKRNIRTITGRIAEHSEQLKKLKEEDGLVVEALPGLEALQNWLLDLRGKKEDLESLVSSLERAAVNPRKVRSESVKSWFRKFDSLEAEVSELKVSMESVGPAETTSKGAATARVAAARIQQLVQSVTELFEQLKGLKQENGLVVEAPPQHVHELPGQLADFVVGIEEKLEEVDKLLNDEETKVVLIHGMGGSGKTTLVRELTQKLKLYSREGDGFDFIFSIVVTQNLDIHKIQGDILFQLGYRRDDPSLPESIDDRASFIKKKLDDMSYLLVLDDVWEPLPDLSKLGFQYSSSKKCKVVVTSRNQDVCEERESLRIFEIGLLEKKHAWQLFCRVCKKGLIESDEQVKSLAWEIVEKCGGLPLLLKTLASAMAKNRVYEDWVVAESHLQKYSDDIKGMKEVYKVLKFSFDRLENDGLKHCLLYCALFPEDYDISLDELIPYLIAEGSMDGRFGFDKLIHKADVEIIRKLEESSLLERGKNDYGEYDDGYVKLHDAVRDMVLSLDNDYKVLSLRVGDALHRISVDDSWVGVRMSSLMHFSIKEIITGGESVLSSLRALLLQFTDFSCLPESLFPRFSSLNILDLSQSGLSEIPKSIGSLKSLRYLNMSHTLIRTLPVEMGNLTNLHTLDLSYTVALTYIPQVAISTLTRLQSLNLYDCPCFGGRKEEEGKLKPVDVSRLLPNLKDVSLILPRTIVADIAKNLFPLASRLRLCDMDIDDVMPSAFWGFQRLKLFGFYWCRFSSSEVEFCRENFCWLKKLILYENKGLRNIIMTSPLRFLRELNVWSCHAFEHLGWIQQLPNLIKLEISDCDGLQELLPKDKSKNNKDESSCRYDDPTILLSKLKDMHLFGLEKLESISSCNLPFPSLTHMRVLDCPRIRSLPIKSSNSVRTTIRCEMEWWESLVWEDDECNSSRFIITEIIYDDDTNEEDTD